jgi:hypothetical protein
MPIRHATHPSAIRPMASEETISQRVRAQLSGFGTSPPCHFENSANNGLTRSLLSALLCLALSGLVACDGGGDLDGSAAEPEVVVVETVLLPPGNTAADLGWNRSNGPVESYMVFESRNASEYAFSQLTTDPTITILGKAGDRVQITVIAISLAGDLSDASPPSPPMLFQAAQPENVQAVSALSSAPPALPNAKTIQEAVEPEGMAAESDQEEALADLSTETAADEQDDAKTDARIAQAIRALLLRGEARLPERGLSVHANQWLQSQVDSAISAGVSLAGTGHQNDDAARELVWQDQAGQLFVSDGQEFIDADDLSSTFVEALRLRATERFVGLADFDGDGQGDWLIEDTATGDVWVVDGASGQAIDTGYTQDAASGGEARLAGHGDFDGDGRTDFLWLGPDNSLEFSRFESANGDEAIPSPSLISPDGLELLAIADLNGDGLDDLLGRSASGSLMFALANLNNDPGDSTLGTDSGTTHSTSNMEWRTGSSATTDGLDLVATFDLDEDGMAEIAFLNGDVIEIWNAESGLQSTWQF